MAVNFSDLQLAFEFVSSGGMNGVQRSPLARHGSRSPPPVGWIKRPRRFGTAVVLWREVGYAATGLYSTAQLVEQKRSALVSRRLVWMTLLQLSQRDGFIMRY